jgi:hypothetical protein
MTSDQWTFLTNHARVLLCIMRDPEARMRDIAAEIGITERAVQTIVADLTADGYVTSERVGRRNSYEVHPSLPFRHPLERPHSVGELLAIFDPAQLKTPARA